MENKDCLIWGYEITDTVHIGDREVVFGVNSERNPNERYLCAYCRSNGLFTQFEEGATGAYLEIMKLFTERVNGQIEKVEKEQSKIIVPLEPITANQCLPDDLSQNIEGKVVAIKEEALRPEYRTADHQLELVLGGFGAYGNARGTAVFCKNLYSGKESRWERYDVQGEVKPECLPDWAKKQLDMFKTKDSTREQNQTEKEER